MAPGGGPGLGPVAAACSIGRRNPGFPKCRAALPPGLLLQHGALCCQGLCWSPAGPRSLWGPTPEGSQGGGLLAHSVYGYPAFLVSVFSSANCRLAPQHLAWAPMERGVHEQAQHRRERPRLLLLSSRRVPCPAMGVHTVGAFCVALGWAGEQPADSPSPAWGNGPQTFQSGVWGLRRTGLARAPGGLRGGGAAALGAADADVRAAPVGHARAPARARLLPVPRHGPLAADGPSAALRSDPVASA